MIMMKFSYSQHQHAATIRDPMCIMFMSFCKINFFPNKIENFLRINLRKIFGHEHVQ